MCLAHTEMTDAKLAASDNRSAEIKVLWKKTRIKNEDQGLSSQCPFVSWRLPKKRADGEDWQRAVPSQSPVAMAIPFCLNVGIMSVFIVKAKVVWKKEFKKKKKKKTFHNLLV